MRRLIQIISISLVVILGAVFAVRNAAQVKLDFYFTGFDTYLSLVVIVSIILVCCLVCWPRWAGYCAPESNWRGSGVR